MKQFLNAYMGKNRALGLNPASEIEGVFKPTIDLVHKSLGPKAFRPQRALNVAVLDSVMVGLARRIAKRSPPSTSAIKTAYDQLLQNKDYMESTERTTANEDAVERRLSLATQALEAAK
jgi:hypothetical protein